MIDVKTLNNTVIEHLSEWIQQSIIANDELTIEVDPQYIHEVCCKLRNIPEFDFNLLVDICGVDYLHFGISEWATESTTATGFERGVDVSATQNHEPIQLRYAVVYHLLSLTHNHRIRLRARLPEKNPTLASVINIWPAANWYEREAFDLFGIQFIGHPDLRRILTDYGFVGHPFRKDFPLIGQVEPRYDAKERRVIYEPVSITPRVLEPKVIRDDTRYKPSE
jgi:NADH-quinone oxidoreductase subunit C